MNIKNIIITIVLIIILFFVAWWILVKYRPPVIEDEITLLLTELKDQTGINFSDIKDVEFKWVVEVDPQVREMNIKGKGFEVFRISDEQFISIRDFFADKGFEADMYNIAAGTVSGMVGYKLASTGEADGKGEARLDSARQVVCHFIGGVAGYKEATGQWIPPEPELKDVEVRCALFSESLTKREKQPIPVQIMDKKVGEEFSIILDANPTTGYQWSIDYDHEYLELMDRRYNSEASPEIVGAGGQEVFKFKALKSGITEIKFSYLRLWESVQPIEEKIYLIEIE